MEYYGAVHSVGQVAPQLESQPRNYDPFGPGFFQESTYDFGDTHSRGLKQAPESNVRAQYHPRSGYHYVLPDHPPPHNLFQEMQDHRLQPERQVNPWYPFDGPGEWSLAKFLVENLSQTQIEQFLKLEWFKTRERPQFKSKDELFYYLEQLPGCGPKWQCTEFHLKGYETEQPIHLIWRDSLEVVKQLFSNPVYANHMCYDPHHIYNGQEREIGEFWTSDDAWNIQACIYFRATIVPIITASDKTPITRHTGGLEMHPLFMTIGNIQSDTLLQTRLWHKCVDLVCSKLKIAARVGEFMVDPSAHRHFCFTPLISHIADLPEQLMIACVSKNSVDPWDLFSFLKEANKLHLSGIHLPFWRDWKYANTATFLTPEILHALHKFFFDHVLKWVKETMGHELDLRFRSQHKHVGVRHFTSGVSHVKQMTGREHRNIQRTIVPTMWGIVTPEFIRAVCAMIDFIYLAQNPVHTDTSIKDMSTALSVFHEHKQAIIDAEARRGKSGAKDDFFIPKLELMQSFARAIPHVGSLIQYSADKTSRQKDFVQQITRILEREETIRLFELYTLLASSPVNDPLLNVVFTEDDEVAGPEVDPALAWVSRVNPDAQRCLHAPCPVRNHFLKGIVSNDAKIAFNVTINPDRKCLTIVELQTLYDLVDFSQALYHYFTINYHGDLNMHSSRILLNAWFKFRIQLHSAFHERTIMPSQLLQAEPPSSEFSYGRCDTVLVQNNRSNVPCVVQVRAVFQPTALPIEAPALDQVLAYVQHFDVIGDKPEPMTGMWRLTRSFFHNVSQPQSRKRCSSIIPITDITHGVELIPVYDTLLAKEVNSSNSMEMFNDYFLNNFADKELYHTLAVAFGV
ncbi:uncharacterized protein F5891DRAFT_1131356 [Suillus fuscotomentosus]|uniref:DUF6830 domain-containing protein n=1 Tax=Suillus fuscotomentosus TaxID=1912939 RepID=A0AAD4DSP4_9AGAM|nr:uncharacterized protein F5891DRAFT_1131356 [Suillus fuscotomentosus]KAG1893228.1 hypothetical protein F5891DRAFT_1131356 [Suillus fuscotomentosus]